MKILKIIISLLVLLNCMYSTSVFANTNSKYVNQYKHIAVSLSSKYQIPSEVILAIAIFESDYGRSKIAVKFNNHFGMVGKNNSKRKSHFKEYKSTKDSYIDFCEKTSNFKRCQNLSLKTKTSIWVDRISRSGYSTQPTKWKKRIMKIISKNKLSV
jgi:Bax protein